MPNRNMNEIKKSSLLINLFSEMENGDESHIAGNKLEIAEQIYGMMKKRRVTQSELARRLGKNRAYISKVLKGTTNFTVETLVKIARKLDAAWDIQLTEVEVPLSMEQHAAKELGIACCGTCAYFFSSGGERFCCRRNPPTKEGFPKVYHHQICGEYTKMRKQCLTCVYHEEGRCTRSAVTRL